jgi:hypothetical protein
MNGGGLIFGPAPSAWFARAERARDPVPVTPEQPGNRHPGVKILRYVLEESLARAAQVCRHSDPDHRIVSMRDVTDAAHGRVTSGVEESLWRVGDNANDLQCSPARSDEVPMGEIPLIQSMRSAVEAAPDDVPLRTHLARLLLESGAHEEAIRQAAALERDPGSADAREPLRRSAPARSGSGKQDRDESRQPRPKRVCSSRPTPVA